MHRRTFVGTVAALANAPHGFPQIAGARSRIDRIGLQLYTVRDLLQRDFEGTLATVARIGYREVEFAGYFGHTPAAVRGILEGNGLTAPAAHVEYKVTHDGWDAALHTARLVGHQFIVTAWIDEGERRNVDDWHRIADRLNHAGQAARDAGLQLAFHNHDYMFVPLADGRLPYDLLLAQTDPTLVQLELDVFWMAFGGGDPLAYFARYPGRFPLVHVKDMIRRPAPHEAPERVMTDVGKGTIDWKRLFSHAGEAGIEHWFVEHDQPADPLASARSRFELLRRLEF
jgi:sugar phosphate isomerase/epimerase